MIAELNYQKICSELLKGLPQRVSTIIERRFGLKSGNRETLEAIGQDFGITRERVRQIENEGLSVILAKKEILEPAYKYINGVLKSFGGLQKEDTLLSVLGGDKFKSHAFFLLSLNKGVKRVSENEGFHTFWMRDEASFNLAKNIINLTIDTFEKEKRTLDIKELFKIEKPGFSKIAGDKINENSLKSFIGISQKIQGNAENVLGLKNWIEINPRGVKDKAYLVLKRNGKPLHFTDVASYIAKSYSPSIKNVHTATVHNELIKDERFVLVGRGLYALKEWGYEPGFVKDIILKILKGENKPLDRREIIEMVSKQRMVKENTILLNLQDKNYFLRDSDGKYKLNPEVHSA
jgi:hypothetical protein